jgi:pyruvate/2-oxoglutarate dehydrogenase complex dihydrolipoamide acyltransferase (E2) component
MQTLYKLTDANGQTRGGCQWGEGVQHMTSGDGPLCDSGWTHWYTDPLLAVFLNPIHGQFDPETMLLWEGEGTIGATDQGLKVGCTDGRTLRQIPVAQVTPEQRVRFAILCVKAVPTRWEGKAEWDRWADAWLDGADRRAAAAAAAAARAAAAEAAEAAEAAAAAARAAARAADIDLIAIAREAVSHE